MGRTVLQIAEMKLTFTYININLTILTKNRTTPNFNASVFYTLKSAHQGCIYLIKKTVIL